MTTKRKRHRWPEASAVRTEWLTVRTCPDCGLEKVTDHNERTVRQYYRYGIGRVVDPMPECEIVK